MSETNHGSATRGKRFFQALAAIFGSLVLFVIWATTQEFLKKYPNRGEATILIAGYPRGAEPPPPTLLVVREVGKPTRQEVRFGPRHWPQVSGLSSFSLYQLELFGPYVSRRITVGPVSLFHGEVWGIPSLHVEDVPPPVPKDGRTPWRIHVWFDSEKYVVALQDKETLVEAHDYPLGPNGSVTGVEPTLHAAMANAWALPASRSPGATPDENVILHVSTARDYDLARQMMESLNRSSFAISGPGKGAAFHVRISPPYLRLPWNKRSSLPEGDPLRMGAFTLYEVCGVMPTVLQRTTYLFGDHGDVVVSRPFTDLPARRCEHGTYSFKDGRMTMRLADPAGSSVESTHDVSMPRPPLVRISNAVEGCNETLFAAEEFASGCAEE